jgi:hypothetical protein
MTELERGERVDLIGPWETVYLSALSLSETPF